MRTARAHSETTGGYVLGACRGPKPWQGRLALKLTPQVTPSGLAIEFVPDSIQLSRPDKSPGLLSKPVQIVADAQSCWRHFAGSSSAPQVLRSASGAVAIMQINGRVWRKVYDMDRLVDKVD